jgi:hypothetical protein
LLGSLGARCELDGTPPCSRGCPQVAPGGCWSWGSCEWGQADRGMGGAAALGLAWGRGGA